MRSTVLRTLFLLAPAVLGSSGCASMFTPQWEGVWLFEVPAIDEGDCLPAVTENFTDAEVPELVLNDEWVYVDDLTLSNSAYFVEILAGKAGQVFVVVGDEVYPGTQDKKSLSVSWDASTDSTHSETHESGYTYSRDELTSWTTTISLIKSDNGVASGQLEIASTSSVDYAETDKWKENQSGIFYSQVPSTGYLTGTDPVNLPDSAECAADSCTLSIDTACSGDTQFTATFAGKYENGMFTGIEDAGQSAGAGGAVIY